MNVQEWKAKGNYTRVYGHAVFNIYHQTNKPTIAFLHGYPSASYDYYKVLPFLSTNFSFIIHDHLGFGLSDKPANYSYSLLEQAEIAIELWKQCGIKEIHLVSHDYGTTVANEIIVRKLQGFEPVKIKSVTFCNGSMHIELAHLKLVQKLLKHPFWGKYIVALMNKRTFVKTMQDIWFDKQLCDVKEMDELWELLMMNAGKDVLHKISQYNNERVKYWNRWIPALSHLDIPTHILWAQQDPIAVKAIAEQLHKEIPDSVYTKIDNCGHYPMLEQPELWIKNVAEFINLKV
ncbi:MAG: alpha/beta hydrolase [Sphingobacteriales bacterium]|nr:alpha/beta hydrolase [Sphingobacteriales bacterium]